MGGRMKPKSLIGLLRNTHCPGYVVVEDARTIGTLSYHGPKRYYPKDGWVRIRPVANPGYRFVRWETGEDVQGAVLGPLGIRTEKDLNGLEEETIAVCMEDDTVITAVFEWAPNPGVSRENGIVTLFSESEEDQALLERADFDPDDDELSRWLKTEASPGEIFKLTVSNPAELSACGVEPSWDWSHEGAHIAGIQPDSSGIAGVAGDVCYVEAKNEYVPADPPIGILRIRVAGGQRILKTIVVEYGDVKEYKLNVTVHDSLPVQESAVREWFETATSSAFLLDELLPPDHQKLRGGGTLKQRLEDTKDVNCPVALCLESFSRFGDADVTQGAEQDVYFDIDSGKEDEAIDGAWANGKHIIIVNRVLYHDGIEYETPIAFAAKSGYSYTPVHQIVLSAANEDGFNLAHEFGHYAGNLDDTYICGNPGHQEWPPDPGCGGQGRDGCICRCPQEALGRRACMCGHKFPHFYPPLENPYNLMSNRKRSAAVLRFQCDALVNGGH